VSDAVRPAPVVTAWSERFWEGLREGRFLLQRCGDCAGYAGYPKLFCPHCHSDGLEWTESSGKGAIYTYSTVTANPPSTFVDELPYTIAIVELEEGVRFLSRLVDLTPDAVRCGLPVQLVIRADGDHVMPFFGPAPAAS
jgi:uncharacterized OB-fold protein